MVHQLTEINCLSEINCLLGTRHSSSLELPLFDKPLTYSGL